jgi:hypothetical protein
MLIRILWISQPVILANLDFFVLANMARFPKIPQKNAVNKLIRVRIR